MSRFVGFVAAVRGEEFIRVLNPMNLRPMLATEGRLGPVHPADRNRARAVGRDIVLGAGPRDDRASQALIATIAR